MNAQKNSTVLFLPGFVLSLSSDFSTDLVSELADDSEAVDDFSVSFVGLKRFRYCTHIHFLWSKFPELNLISGNFPLKHSTTLCELYKQGRLRTVYDKPRVRNFPDKHCSTRAVKT